MPFESVVVIVAVVCLFAAFALGLTYADLQTRQFRD